MIRDATIDQAIVDPRVYASGRDYHALFERLRSEDPVHWTQPAGFEPFWTVSKHADIIEIERQNSRFLNAPRLNMRPDEVEAHFRARVGRQSPFRMIVNMDDPDHRKYRALTQAWFLPPNLRKLDGQIAMLAREFVDRIEALGDHCDFVRDVAVWYPLRVIMMILGIPREDEQLMLRLTQESFGAEDPDLQGQEDFKETRARAMSTFLDYFRGVMADRRRAPRDDLASVIAHAEVDGQPIGELEVISYYLVIATAGHDTTSSSSAGGLLALIENPRELDKLRARPDLLPSAIDEMIRWVTPVKHFVRTAAEDYVLRGRNIQAGQRLMMCYPSANRDEDVFEDPFAFRVDRAPNKQLAFGIGVHQCLGLHLARMEMRAFFQELLARIDHVELAGEPANVAATFVSGLKRLPIRYRMRPRSA
jgi:cytochrome P450